MATELVVDFDEPTKTGLAVELLKLNALAKREFAVVGTPLRPTPWDVRHRSINNLLDQYERATA